MAQQLKTISAAAIPAALEKAERYRLLNEPQNAESICRDVLAVEPTNQRALVNLILSLTDQFVRGAPRLFQSAREALPLLDGEYERIYYEGLICERMGKAALDSPGPGSGSVIYEWLSQAMDCYDRAESLAPADNNESALRFNTCVRIIQEHPNVEPEHDAPAPGLE